MNDYDPSLWPTRHMSEGEILRQMISDQVQAQQGGAAPYTLTRGDQVGILLTQIAELHHALAEARRLNQMLNNELRIQREQRQLQEQPAPLKRKGGVEL